MMKSCRTPSALTEYSSVTPGRINRTSLSVTLTVPVDGSVPWSMNPPSRREVWSAVAGGEWGWHRFALSADGLSQSGVCPHPSPLLLVTILVIVVRQAESFSH